MPRKKVTKKVMKVASSPEEEPMEVIIPEENKGRVITVSPTGTTVENG